MATSISQIRDLLLPGLNAVFGEMPQMPKQYTEIFDEYSSDMNFERDVEVKIGRAHV